MVAPGQRLSVVIPVYNAQEWIAETLASVLAQQDLAGPLDVVVVSDGSADRSLAIAHEILRNSSIPYQLLEIENSGPVRARNVGWNAAKGDWIQFLDADDLLHPLKLAAQAKVAMAQPAEVAVVYSDWQRLHCQDGQWKKFEPYVRPAIGADTLADLLLTENALITGSSLFRRGWLASVGGWDDRHSPIEDIHLVLRLAQHGGRFAAAPSAEPLYFYRCRPGSFSQSCQRRFIDGCVANAKMVEEHWAKLGGPTRRQARVLADIYLQAVRFFADSDPRESSRWSAEIERLVPGYVPPGRAALTWLSRLLGFRRAENLARPYRRLKRWLSSRALGS